MINAFKPLLLLAALVTLLACAGGDMYEPQFKTYKQLRAELRSK